MSTEGTRSDHITKQRQAVTQLMNALDNLRVLRIAWDVGYNVWVTEDDFTGSNEGLVKADIEAVTGTTLDAIEALGAGHFTNLENIRL